MVFAYNYSVLLRATEYIKGTTKNPLVVGPNVTTRSDARIFSSDGNSTMKALVFVRYGIRSIY
jgi:hypothetical protein